jgi:hypothetical protein
MRTTDQRTVCGVIDDSQERNMSIVIDRGASGGVPVANPDPDIAGG